MSGAHDTGKGDDSRIRNIKKYSERNEEIRWPGREAKRQREKLAKRLQGRNITPCPESDFMKHLD